jgi:hypothetical protein
MGACTKTFLVQPQERMRGVSTKTFFFKAFIVEMPDWEHKPNLD